MSRAVAEKAFLYVNLPTGYLAIPTCAMVRAKQSKFYTDRHNSATEFVKSVTRSILDGSSGVGMSTDQKDIVYQILVVIHRYSANFEQRFEKRQIPANKVQGMHI